MMTNSPSPIGQLPTALCTKCGLRPSIGDPAVPGIDRITLCPECFLKTLDLVFYEFDQYDAAHPPTDEAPPTEPGR